MFISGTQARQLVEQGAQLVDVRSAAEYQTGSAPGAINVPVHVIPVAANEHLDNDKPVVVYCMSGARSAQAAMILQSLGFADVHNVGTLTNFIRG
jgi:phage shock protein E